MGKTYYERLISMRAICTIPRPAVRANQWTIFLSALLTWMTGLMWILVIPLVANLLGIFFNLNPVIRVANLFLKKSPKEYILEDASQQKFTSILSATFLGLGYISFLINWNVAGYFFTALVGITSFVAILGFCVGYFILFKWKQYFSRHSTENL